ncbi:MAG: DUF433 domain-containing protein [Acidimicrobiales bacterium]
MSGRRVSLFGEGVYDLQQVSHLLGIDYRTIRRWSQSTDQQDALVTPTHGWAFSFHDLLSLAVIAVFRQRGVTANGVRETVKQLAVRFAYDRPLAHRDVVKSLQTAGPSVILTAESSDLSAGGQGVLIPTVEKYLRPLEYGADGLATLWRPAPKILVMPGIQVGHPCIDGTRITTETIAGRAAQDEPPKLIADDLNISLAEVRAAIRFETRLDQGHGMAKVA